MAVHFTNEQQLAIDTLDRSILVSAAAGSGKTAVLVERILHIILAGEANVDEMLVVTFTNAAAAEMKLKLTKALKQRMKEDPSNAPAMSAQLNRMYRSYISTFHSFALRLIREFFYRIDREPTFRICDEAQSGMLQLEAMDELFDQCFEQDAYIEGGSFRDFLHHYSSDRSEDDIVQELIRSYNELRSIPKYFEWAESKVELLRMPESGDLRESVIFARIMERVRTELRMALQECEALHDLLDDGGMPKLAAKIAIEREELRALQEESEHVADAEAFFVRMAGWKAQTLRKTKDEADAYAEVQELCKAMHDGYKGRIKKGIVEAYGNPGLAVRFREMDATRAYTTYYLQLLRAFETRYEEKKRALDYIDFSDIEHICVQILDDPEVAEIIRKRFRFVFVDEYQDTNPLQEYLIAKISRPDNVFKVGDIKQSIYRFRQSDPTIFQHTREEFARPDNADAMVIDLNRNFRSSASTIQYINEVFGDVMPGYDDQAKLNPGPRREKGHDLVPEVHVLVQNAGEDAPVEPAGDEDEEQASKAESEAAYIARLVKRLIGTEFYDGKKDIVRKATPRDIVVLMRSTRRNADTYYKAMLEQDVMAYVSEDGGYFDTVEIHVATALLSLLDNGQQDVPLIAVLRSEIFGFTTEELAVIRAAYRESGGAGAYWKAVAYYLEGEEDALAGRLRDAMAQLDAWRDLANTMPLDDYIWHVLTDSGYYLYAGAMYGGRQRQANLRVLAERARRYQENGVASLSGFLRYIEVLRNKKELRMGPAAMVSEDDDVVRIMTMHKSKGLEFPFVIVAGMGNRLTYDHLSKGLMFDSELGVSLAYVDRDKRFYRPTLQQQLIVDKKRDDGYEEELRILYVAMTRAKEKLILVGTIRDEQELDGLSESGSFYKIIKNTLHTEGNTFQIGPVPPRRLTRKVNRLEEFLRHRLALDPSRAAKYAEQVRERLDYTYPYAAALETKAKYTVSELQAEQARGVLPRRVELVEPEFRTEPVVQGAEVGTAYHRILQMVDFRMHDRASIEAAARQLTERGAIRREVLERVQLERIEAFFDTPIGRRAAAAAQTGTLRKEKPFTMQTMHEGQSVLVQGMIDCYFAEGEELILIDYKSNTVHGSAKDIIERYRRQLQLYRQALEAGTGRRVTESYLYLFHLGEAVRA